MKHFCALLILIVALGISPPARATTITYWQCKIDESDFLTTRVNQFTRNTGVQVKVVHPNCTDMRRYLTSAAALGTTPDVALVYSNWATVLADTGVFVNLNTYMQVDREAHWQDLFPAALQLWRNSKGETVGIPTYLDVTMLYFSKPLFDQNGISYPDNTTWPEALHAARKMTQDISGDGVLDVFGFTNWWFNWSPIVWAYGGDFLNLERNGSLLSSAPTQTALKLYRGFYEYHVFPNALDVQQLGHSNLPDVWRNGMVAMAPANLLTAGEWLPQENAGKVWIAGAELPKSPTGKRATTIDGEAMVLFSSSKEKDAAYRFITYMQSEQSQGNIQYNAIPARRSVAAQQGTDALALQAAPYARTNPTGCDWWGSIWPAIYQNLSPYFNGKVGLEQATMRTNQILRALLGKDPVVRYNR